MTKITKKNYGKEFERQVFKDFSKIDDVSIDRIPDQMTKYRGSSSNICDFIVYRKPTLIYLECKSVHGNTLSIYSIPKLGKDGKLHGFYGDIRDSQWEGLLEKSEIDGIVAGVICWYVDKDITRFFPIKFLKTYRDAGNKSIRFDVSSKMKDIGVFDDAVYYNQIVEIKGRKKRTLFDYDMQDFLNAIEN